MSALYDKKRAFVLPEALISIVLLASLVLYFILAFTVGKYATQLSKNRMIMSNLLRSEMENILATSYVNLAPISQAINVDDGSKIIPVTKTISLTTEDPDIYGYKKVYVKLEWTGGISRNQMLKEEAILYVTRE